MKPTVPVKLNDTINIAIDRLSNGGEGIGQIEGYTVFVPYALPGETAQIKISLVKKNYARAEIVSLEKCSPDRIVPRCPVYEKCGGCQLQHLGYEAQLKLKRQTVIDALTRIGGFTGIEVKPVIGAENPWGYRNKMMLPVGKSGGKISIGCYAQGTHDIIDAVECAIQPAANNALAAAAKAAMERFNLPPYNEDAHSGLLRHVVGRLGKDGQQMAVLVTATPKLPQAKAIVNFLRERLPRLVSVQQNIQTYRNNVILGRETKTLWGKETIIDQIAEFNYRISARSFFQVNTAQAEMLYKTVRGLAALTGGETVIDAYCGTGTISLFLAKRAKKVYGIEIVSAAIADAKKNARENGIRNAEFIVGDAAAIMPKLCRNFAAVPESGGSAPDLIVLDPPRAGCDEKVLQAILRLKPPKIIYVSCNPATLARDLKTLVPDNYKIETVQPVDMFPQTMHVEVITELTPVPYPIAAKQSFCPSALMHSKRLL